ncbi:MAG TPA: hypothetical protein EYG13_06170 [Dehalococcoidia bacterium]|nr:hypothetical protein [Dehalococcoidia bacterium]
MEVSRLTGVLGARVDGVQLAPDMDPATVTVLRDALCEHEVLVVPRQNLSADQQAGFSHLLGGFSPVPFVQPVPEHPEVIKVVKEASETEAFNWIAQLSPELFKVDHATRNKCRITLKVLLCRRFQRSVGDIANNTSGFLRDVESVLKVRPTEVLVLE